MTLALFRSIIRTNIPALSVSPLHKIHLSDPKESPTPPFVLFTRVDFTDYPALSGADDLNTILVNTYLCCEDYSDNESYSIQLKNLLNCLQGTYILSGVSYFINSIYLKNWVDLHTTPYKGRFDGCYWSRQTWRITWREL